jgi:hypothetical protein
MTKIIDFTRKLSKLIYELLVIVFSLIALGYLLLMIANFLGGRSNKRYHKRF